MKAKKGFTLVEILIVVVILGILAAIVIPQFTSASTEAKESALQSDLQAMRSQIELFKIHHNDLLPGEIGTGPLDPALVAATSATFEDALTSKTDLTGAVGNLAAHRFGPYMRRVPDNPFCSLVPANTVEVDGAPGGDSHGWHITTVGENRGLFQADDPGVNNVTSQLHIDY
jgi:general secretion pathway protein G